MQNEIRRSNLLKKVLYSFALKIQSEPGVYTPPTTKTKIYTRQKEQKKIRRKEKMPSPSDNGCRGLIWCRPLPWTRFLKQRAVTVSRPFSPPIPEVSTSVILDGKPGKETPSAVEASGLLLLLLSGIRTLAVPSAPQKVITSVF